jgi:hypothetical protein
MTLVKPARPRGSARSLLTRHDPCQTTSTIRPPSNRHRKSLVGQTCKCRGGISEGPRTCLQSRSSSQDKHTSGSGPGQGSIESTSRRRPRICSPHCSRGRPRWAIIESNPTKSRQNARRGATYTSHTTQSRTMPTQLCSFMLGPWGRQLTRSVASRENPLPAKSICALPSVSNESV